jgi:hypothetical protein
VKGVREVVKEVKASRPLSKEDIVKLRKKLRVSQSAFARAAEHFDKNRSEMGARRESAERIEPQTAYNRKKESEDAVCTLERVRVTLFAHRGCPRPLTLPVLTGHHLCR